MKILVSAGDAITAKLVEEAGFSGIWVSGFEASARLGLQDNGSITMTEMLRVTEPIVKAVGIPVYVDTDTGYGNFKRTCREFTDIGVTGISVEDNMPDKANSLWGGKMPLMPPEDFLKKINIDTELEIIARTEALIRGYGIQEAVRRAHMYQCAATYILIHSRDRSGIEPTGEIPDMYKGSVPLVIVPTKFPHVSFSELERCGYAMAICANQTERVKIKSIRAALEQINAFDNLACIEDSLSASLDDMKGLMVNDY